FPSEGAIICERFPACERARQTQPVVNTALSATAPPQMVLDSIGSAGSYPAVLLNFFGQVADRVNCKKTCPQSADTIRNCSSDRPCRSQMFFTMEPLAGEVIALRCQRSDASQARRRCSTLQSAIGSPAASQRPTRFHRKLKPASRLDIPSRAP